MKKKQIKIIMIVCAGLFLAYHSVFFKRLDEVKAAEVSKFNAAAYADKFWNRELIPSLKNAISIESLFASLKANSDQAFKKHGNSLGIGHISYFMVSGEAIVKSVNEDNIEISIANNSNKLFLETEYVYGNAVRDASGLIKINEFENTMDLNNVSEEINQKIRTEVIKPFKSAVNKDDHIKFIAALELNSKHPDTEELTLIPVKLELIK